MAQYIEVHVASAELLDELPAGSYFVEVTLPPEVCKNAAKTPKAEHNGLRWNYTGEFKVSGALPADTVASVKFLKAGIRTTDVASGVMAIGKLGEGAMSIEDTITLKSDSTEMVKLDIAFAWKAGSGPNQAPATKPMEVAADDGDKDDDKEAAKAEETARKKKKLTPLPNCEFNDYNVRVRVHKARNLQAEKDGKQLSPLLRVDVGVDSASTEYIKDSNNPTWDEELVFTCAKVGKDFWNRPITITAYDHRMVGSNKKIGGAQLDCAAVYRENAEHFMAHKWFALLKNVTEGTVMGFVKCSVAVLNTREDPVPEDVPDPNEGNEEAITSNLVAGPGAMFENVYLEFDVVRAEGLPVMDSALFGGKADPYVKFTYGTKKVKTAWIPTTLTPEWNSTVTLPITLPALTGTVSVSLFDHDKVGSDDLIARHKLSIHDLTPHPGTGGDDGAATAGNGGGGGGGHREDTLPRLAAQWVNFYGHPRNIDAGFSSWYTRMADGEVEGVEYRGRLLLGMNANRGDRAAREVTVPTTVDLDVVILVQVMVLNMVPAGKYKLRLSVGELSTSTPPRRADRMHGDTSLCAIYFDEEIMIRGTFSVVPPPADAKSRMKFIAQQIPDAILTLVEIPIVKGPLYHPDEPLAYKRWPIAAMVREGKGVYSCECLKLNQETHDVAEGAAPVAPMGQMVCGAFFTKCDPMVADLARQSVPMPGLSSGDTKKFLLEACVYHVEHIPAGDSNGLSDPYIRVSWANGVAETGYKRETCNPTYNELLRLEADCKPRQRFPDIVVEIWDWDRVGWDTFLCRRVVSFGEAEKPDRAGKYQWIDGFVDNRGNPVPTRAVMSFEVVAGTPAALKAKPKRVAFKRKPGKSSDTYDGYEIPAHKALPLVPYEVSVHLHALRNMKKFRLRAIQTPSVYLQFMEQVFHAEKEEGPNPTYDKSAAMTMLLPSEEKFLPSLQVLVYDHRVGPKVLVGSASDSLEDPFYHPRRRADVVAAEDREVTKRFDKMMELKGAKPRSAAGMAKAARRDARHRKRQEKVEAAMRAAAERARLEEAALAVELSLQHAPGSSRPPTLPRRSAPPSGPRLYDDNGDGDEMVVPLLATGGGGGRDTHTADEDEVASTGGETSATDASDGGDTFEPEWFEKYDGRGTVRPDDIVTRLGALRSSCHLPPRKTTAEDYFGPFDDFRTLELRRGWGSDMVKAGNVRIDVSISRLPPSSHDEAAANTGRDAKLQPHSLVGSTATSPGDGDDDQGDHDGSSGVRYLCRVYVISCRNLDACDFGPLGGSSDPYVCLSLMGHGMEERDMVRVKCDDEASKRYCTLNPDYFFVRELEGSLPKHNLLRVTLMDYDTIGSDDIIGHAYVNLEDRWNGRRCYDRGSGRGRAHETMTPGSYTERRTLFNDSGAQAGSVELWVDLFDLDQVAPHPLAVVKAIDITPPPTLELEVRATIWATRDVELVDVGQVEDTVDIYVRGHMDGMRHNIQQTDVHYRSTDGSGSFNWLMSFPMRFEPRHDKVYPIPKESAFSIFRKEPKLMDPVLQLEVLDNETLFSDQFIGGCALNLLDLKPCVTQREPNPWVEREPRCCWWCNCWPWSRICLKRRDAKPSLRERQAYGMLEEMREREAREQEVNRQVNERMKPIETAPTGTFSDRVKRKLRLSFEKETRELMRVNIFAPLLPTRKKKIVTASARSENASEDVDARIIETPKYWVACKAPKGNTRVGDVQVSFTLVKTAEIQRDSSLAAVKGRSVEADRPEQPDFLKDPTRAAYLLLWRQYKYYLLTATCLVLSLVYILLLTKRGLDRGVDVFFE
jgi:hypothetical protein